MISVFWAILFTAGFLSIVMAPLFWCEIFPSIMSDLRGKKQGRCFHLWRRLDADYQYDETLYRYRCKHCKLEKNLWEHQSKRFENDFMSD